MQVPTYPDDAVSSSPNPSVRGADISAQNMAVGQDQATALADVSAFLEHNVQQGKERALDDYKRQLDEAHVAIQLNAMSLQDQDALQSTQIAMQQWKDVVAKVSADVGFADVADKLNSYAAQRGAMLEDSVADHERSEATKFDAKNVEARQRLFQTTAALNAGNGLIVAAQVQQAQETRKSWCARNGIPTEGDEKQTALFRELQQADTSKVFVSTIDALLISGNIAGAKTWFDTAKQNNGMTADDINETAKKFLAAEQAQKESALTAYLNMAMRPENRFKDISTLDKTTWESFDPKDREALYNAVKPKFQNELVWAPFYEKITKHPEQVVSMSGWQYFNKYVQHFDEQHQDWAWRLWNDAISSAQKGDSNNLKQAITDLELMKKEAVAFDILPEQAHFTPAQVAQMNSKYILEATRQLQEATIANNNIPLTFAKKKEIIDKVCLNKKRMQVETKLNHPFDTWGNQTVDVPEAAIAPTMEGRIVDTPGKQALSSTKSVPVSQAPTSYIMGDPIPTAYVQAIQAQLRARNLDPTNRLLVQKIYAASLQGDAATVKLLLGGKLQ